jgi:hypothetical protein
MSEDVVVHKLLIFPSSIHHNLCLPKKLFTAWLTMLTCGHIHDKRFCIFLSQSLLLIVLVSASAMAFQQPSRHIIRSRAWGLSTPCLSRIGARSWGEPSRLIRAPGVQRNSRLLSAAAGMPYSDDKMPYYALGTNLALQVGGQGNLKSLLSEDELEIVLQGMLWI